MPRKMATEIDPAGVEPRALLAIRASSKLALAIAD